MCEDSVYIYAVIKDCKLGVRGFEEADSEALLYAKEHGFKIKYYTMVYKSDTQLYEIKYHFEPVEKE